MSQNRIIYLLQQYVSKAISWEELNELSRYLAERGNGEFLKEFMDKKFEDQLADSRANEVDWEFMYKSLIAKDPSLASAHEVHTEVSVPVYHKSQRA